MLEIDVSIGCLFLFKFNYSQEPYQAEAVPEES
jgi:hypothetical protein